MILGSIIRFQPENEKHQFVVVDNRQGYGAHKLLDGHNNVFILTISGYIGGGFKGVFAVKYVDSKVYVVRTEIMENDEHKIIELWDKKYIRENKKNVLKQAKEVFDLWLQN